MATDSMQSILSQIRQLSLDEQRTLVEEVQRSLSTPAKQTSGVSLLNLRGLGKEVWRGVDVQEYLRGERDAWDG